MSPTASAPGQPIQIDLLLKPGWIIPIEPLGVTLQNHALAVTEGKIVDLLPYQLADQRFSPKKTLSLPGQVLLPGFVNLHTHAAMSLLRGYADDLPLMQWLRERIWPAEIQHVSPDFVEVGTALACAEMLCGGITCFNDMYFFPESAALAASQAGIRAALGMIVIEFPSAYAGDAEDYIAKGLAARDASIDNPLISYCFAPHAPYTVADTSFEKIVALADQFKLPIHVHIHETLQEIQDSVQEHGVRPLQRLYRLGVVGPSMIGVHGVHLTMEELDCLAHEGAHIAHCPTSNLKLGSGIAPMTAIHSRGINFGLGTDGAASNNRLDPFREIRLAALLAKGADGDPAAMSSHVALHAATLGGAKALGLDQKIGSLVSGKDADLCTVRLDEWISQPCFDPASHLVFVSGREQVVNVWVAGKQQVIEGKLDQEMLFPLIESVKLWHTRLKS